MAANITDLVSRVTDSNTGRPIIGELASPGKALGAASINLAAATNWTTETAIHISIYETTTVGTLTVKDTTTQTDWKGTLSGVAIGNLTLTGGTDRAYTAGAIVEITPTARYAKDLYDWAMVQHNQNGTHKNLTTDTLTVTGALTLAAGTIETADLANSSVTPDKVNLSSVTALVGAAEVAGGATYADLTTVGPSVTVTVPANGRMTVSFAASINSNDVANAGRAAFTLSGANTRAAVDDEAIESQTIYNTCSRTISLTGLTPGSTTVKMVYLRTGGTSTFRRRSLTVTPGL